MNTNVPKSAVIAGLSRNPLKMKATQTKRKNPYPQKAPFIQWRTLPFLTLIDCVEPLPSANPLGFGVPLLFGRIRSIREDRICANPLLRVLCGISDLSPLTINH
jgi:hypothetical protein